MEISESEMEEAKKICKSAREKCICRTDRVTLAAAIYAIKRNKDRENFPTQMQVADAFKCSQVSLRRCFHAMYEKGVIEAW